MLETDSQRLRQILRNLLSNALKFTDARQRAAASLCAQPATGDLRSRSRTRASAFAADKQEIIFEPFRQADGTTNRRFGGTGLGLSISRELAAMLGGRIELHSEPGVGSTFTLMLPQTHAGASSEGDDRAVSLAPRSVPVALARTSAAETRCGSPRP